jgi:hypothetical protein
MGGFVAMVYAMIPAVAALGAVSTPVAIPLLALGAAMLMIGGGIALATLGIAKMVASFAGLTNGQIVGALLGLTLVMGGFTAMVIALGSASLIAGPELLLLGGAMLMIGGGIALASLGMSKFVDSINKMNPAMLSDMGAGLIKFSLGLGGLVAGMFLAIPALLAFGVAGLVAAPGLLALAAALPLVSYGFSTFSDSISKINPGALTQIGIGLKDFSSGLLSLSASMFAFSNPISIIAFGAMIVQLAALAGVMNALGPNLESAGDGMSKMADGVMKLSTAMNSLNTDKLNKIEEIGSNISSTSALVSAVNSLTSVVGGDNKSGGTKRFEIEVVVKNENGRELSRRIIKDNELTH